MAFDQAARAAPPNPFDEFDALPVASARNPFDEFDAPAPVPQRFDPFGINKNPNLGADFDTPEQRPAGPGYVAPLDDTRDKARADATEAERMGVPQFVLDAQGVKGRPVDVPFRTGGSALDRTVGSTAGMLTGEEAYKQQQDRLAAARKEIEEARADHDRKQAEYDRLVAERGGPGQHPFRRELRRRVGLGQAGQRLKSAEAELREANLSGLPTQTGARDKAERLVKMAAGAATGAIRNARGLLEMANQPSAEEELGALVLGQDPAKLRDMRRKAQQKLKEATDALDKAAEKWARPDVTQDENFGSRLTEGGASMAIFMAGGLAARALKLPGAVGSAGLGAFQMGGDALKEVEDKIAAAAARGDKTEVERLSQVKYIAMFANMGLGATEAIPLERFINRLNKATGNKVAHILDTSGKQTLENVMQEVGQGVSHNAVAKLLYDEGREIFGQDVTQSAEVAAVLSALMGAGAGATGRRPLRPGESLQSWLSETPAEMERDPPVANATSRDPPGALNAPPVNIPAGALPAESVLPSEPALGPTAPPPRPSGPVTRALARAHSPSQAAPAGALAPQAADAPNAPLNVPPGAEPDPAAVRRAYGYSDEQIQAPAPSELAAEHQDALDAGVVADNDVTPMIQAGMSTEEAVARSLGNHLDPNKPDIGKVQRKQDAAPPPTDTAGLTPVSAGTRQAPVKIETPDDVHLGAEQTATPTSAQAEPKPAAASSARKRGPLSLIAFLASRGGIRGDDPLAADLRQALGGNRFVPGFGMLIRPAREVSTAARQGGRSAPMSLDQARAAAAEGGYPLPGETTDARMGETTIRNLLDLVEQEARGGKVYSEHDAAGVAERRQRDFERARRRAESEVREAAKAEGIIPGDQEVRDAAALVVQEQRDPADALVHVIERNAIASEGEEAKNERAENVDARQSVTTAALPARAESAAASESARLEPEATAREAPARVQSRQDQRARGQAQGANEPGQAEEPSPAQRRGDVEARSAERTSAEAAEPERQAARANRPAEAVAERTEASDRRVLRGTEKIGQGEAREDGRERPEAREDGPSDSEAGFRAGPGEYKFVDLGPFEIAPGEEIGRKAQDYVVRRGREADAEFLIAVDAEGKVIAHGRGAGRNIGLSPALKAALDDPQQAVVVHHNHPSDRSFSVADIEMLASPGLKALWAHGHGASVSRAELRPEAREALGDRQAKQRLRVLAERIDRVVHKILLVEVRTERLTADEANAIHNHLDALILQDAGIIDYESNIEASAAIARLGLQSYIDEAAAAARRSVYGQGRDAVQAGRLPDRSAGSLRHHPGDLGASFGRDRGAAGRRRAEGGGDRVRPRDRGGEEGGEGGGGTEPSGFEQPADALRSSKGIRESEAGGVAPPETDDDSGPGGAASDSGPQLAPGRPASSAQRLPLHPQERVRVRATSAFTASALVPSRAVDGRLRPYVFRRAMAAELRAELDRLGLKDIDLRIVERLEALIGGRLRAADGQYFERVITLALQSADDQKTILHHEAVHALRALRLFMDSEWAMLERASNGRWRKQYDIDRRYAGRPEAERIEEGVAHAYADWQQGHSAPEDARKRAGEQTDGRLNRLFMRIRDVLSGLGRALRKVFGGADIKTVEELFRAIERGEIGRRPRLGRMEGKGARLAAAEQDTFAAELLQELAANDEAFEYPRSTATTVAGVIADIDPQVIHVASRTRHSASEASAHYFKSAKGSRFAVYENDKEVWLTVPVLTEGSRGSAIYSAVGNYAYNTGKVFKGDPLGLSDVALRRRTENMLSSALKLGTTRHLEPHEYQRRGKAGLGVPRLHWRKGDDLGNIQSLIEVSTQSLIHHVPEIQNVTYDFTTGTFRDGEGKPITDERFSRWRSSPGGRAASAGRRTLQRGILQNTLLRRAREEGPGLLEHFLHDRDQRVVPRGAFYALPRPDHAVASAFDAADQKRIDRVRHAIDRVIAGKTSARYAVKRSDIGPLTIDWGKPGDSRKQFRDGWGISHIIARRDLEGNDGEAFVREKLPEVLVRGEIARRYGSEAGPRIDLVLGNVTAALSLRRFGKHETWLITAFEREKVGPGGRLGLSPSSDLRSEPSRYLGEEGAGPTDDKILLRTTIFNDAAGDREASRRTFGQGGGHQEPGDTGPLAARSPQEPRRTGKIKQPSGSADDQSGPGGAASDSGPKFVAAKGIPSLRQQYVDAVEGLAGKAADMRAAGNSAEQIARTLHADRRALGVQFKDLTPEAKRIEIYERNIAKYGDKLGPSIDLLRTRGKSWEQIIESATRTGGKDLKF